MDELILQVTDFGCIICAMNAIKSIGQEKMLQLVTMMEYTMQ